MRVMLTEEGVKLAHYKAVAGEIIDIPEDEARVHLMLHTAVEAPPPRPPRAAYVPTGRPRGRPRREAPPEATEGEAEQHVVGAEGDVQADAEHVPEPSSEPKPDPEPQPDLLPDPAHEEDETTRFYRRRDLGAEG